jgi:hypothetical protein
MRKPKEMLALSAVIVWIVFTGGLAWFANWVLRYRTEPVRLAGALVLPVAVNGLLLLVLVASISSTSVEVTSISPPVVSDVPSSIDSIRPSNPSNDAKTILSRQAAELLPGLVVFNPPAEMVVGRHETITVRLMRGLADKFSTHSLQGRGAPQIERVKIGTFMRTRLYGNGFEVTTHSDESQAVVDNDFAEWLFDVLPLHSGKQTLTLQIAIRYKLSSSEEITNLPVLTRDIAVQVNTWWSIEKFVSENWQWLFGGVGGVLLSLAGFFGKRWFEKPRSGNQNA